MDSTSYTYNWTTNNNAIDYSQYSTFTNYQVSMPARPSPSSPQYYGVLNVTLAVTTIALVNVTSLQVTLNATNLTSQQFSLVCSKHQQLMR